MQFDLVFLQHVYVSLSELQVKKEEEINKNPISKGEEEIPDNATEVLYQAMLPNLPQYMVSIKKLKMLFGCHNLKDYSVILTKSSFYDMDQKI